VLPCVILAGGLGMRMRPVTNLLPKSLVPVLGRPFAELQLEWLAGEGIDHVIYSIGYKGEMIRAALGSGSRFHVRIEYVDEGTELRGSGGALRLALDLGILPDQFFILYGDAYLSVSLGDVLRAWRSSGLPAIMTVMRNSNRWDTSNAVLRDGQVLYDKRRSGEYANEMTWIDYGLSGTTSAVIAERLPAGGRGDLADLLHVLSVEGKVAGFEVAERFYEVGSPTGLRDLEAHLSECTREQKR
jgi:NDP-sugar pyrophosphorylase family protein